MKRLYRSARGLALLLVLSSLLGFASFRLRNHPSATGWTAPRIDASSAYSQRDSIQFVDPRPVRTYGEGHIPGALNLHEEDPRIKGLSQDKLLVVYCDSVCLLADQTASRLRDQGYAKIQVLQGGLPAWQTAGFPIQTGPEDE